MSVTRLSDFDRLLRPAVTVGTTISAGSIGELLFNLAGGTSSARYFNDGKAPSSV